MSMTRGTLLSSQIITLERLLEEREAGLAEAEQENNLLRADLAQLEAQLEQAHEVSDAGFGNELKLAAELFRLSEQIAAREAELADLKEANRQLAAAAIEKPPYKADLQAELTRVRELYFAAEGHWQGDPTYSELLTFVSELAVALTPPENQENNRLRADLAELEVELADMQHRIGRVVHERDLARDELTRVLQHYEARSELYTNDGDLAAGMADIARVALIPLTDKSRQPEQEKNDE